MSLSRKHFGNIGGLSHLTGNFCLLAKGMITAILAGQVLDFKPLLTQWPATLSGFIFLVSAGIIARYGHLTKGFILSYTIALVGYSILGIDALLHGPTATVVGVAVGMVASVYALATATRYNFRFLSVNTRYLNRRLKNALKRSIEIFPYWPSGAIEFLSEFTLLVGALVTGDVAMAIIAGLWASGSLLLGSALPATIAKI